MPSAPVPLAAGETRTFEIALAAGKAYALAVEQQGIHLTVDVRDPQGESVAMVDSPLDRWGSGDRPPASQAATGTYRVEVRAPVEGRRARPLRDPSGRDRRPNRRGSPPWRR